MIETTDKTVSRPRLSAAARYDYWRATCREDAEAAARTFFGEDVALVDRSAMLVPQSEVH